MIKASLLLMLLLTVLIGMGLRWRQDRVPQVGAAARRGRQGFLARGKARIDLWITAAAIASLISMLLMGGLHWIRVWLGHG